MYQQNYENQQLQCVECGKIFDFSAEDQEFYAKKGYSSPKRCPECRENRKARTNSGGSRRGFKEKREYPVICAACGCETTVPFKPSDDRPVFCSDCYKKNQY
jgi:CxxC-x17-CxxC domain-containing protein